MVQPPGECFQSGAGDHFFAVQATSSGLTTTLTGGFDYTMEFPR